MLCNSTRWERIWRWGPLLSLLGGGYTPWVMLEADQLNRVLIVPILLFYSITSPNQDIMFPSYLLQPNLKPILSLVTDEGSHVHNSVPLHSLCSVLPGWLTLQCSLLQTSPLLHAERLFSSSQEVFPSKFYPTKDTAHFCPHKYSPPPEKHADEWKHICLIALVNLSCKCQI